MQVGVIRREALRLMFAAGADVPETATLWELYQNPGYAVYLGSMDMCINRALLRMQTVGALPMGRVEIAPLTVTGSVATFNLAAIPDCDGVEELMAQDGNAYAAHAYRWEGGTTLVVPFYNPDERYVLLYRKKLDLLAPLCADTVEVAVPDALAVLIPYYVKAELYEEEDAVAAKRARDCFEAGLADYVAAGHGGAPVVALKYQWGQL